MSHPETATYSSCAERTEKFSTQSSAQKQYFRTQKDQLPRHIKHMFDEVAAIPGKQNDKLIDSFSEKGNGKWEMNLTVRCYIHRDGT